jgi:hypothetical protein
MPGAYPVNASFDQSPQMGIPVEGDESGNGNQGLQYPSPSKHRYSVNGEPMPQVMGPTGDYRSRQSAGALMSPNNY